MANAMISPVIYSATFGLFLFYFFRWVFMERYTADVARNYAIIKRFYLWVHNFWSNDLINAKQTYVLPMTEVNGP